MGPGGSCTLDIQRAMSHLYCAGLQDLGRQPYLPDEYLLLPFM